MSWFPLQGLDRRYMNGMDDIGHLVLQQTYNIIPGECERGILIDFIVSTIGLGNDDDDEPIVNSWKADRIDSQQKFTIVNPNNFLGW